MGLWCLACGSEVPGTAWDLLQTSEVGAVLWDWALGLWDPMLSPGRQCQN